MLATSITRRKKLPAFLVNRAQEKSGRDSGLEERYRKIKPPLHLPKGNSTKREEDSENKVQNVSISETAILLYGRKKTPGGRSREGSQGHQL